eukprot:2340731-Pleurochrysis_carterae.AAC.1
MQRTQTQANSEVLEDIAFGIGNNFPRTEEANKAAGNILVDLKQASHFTLQAVLIDHFHVQYVKKNLLWARTAQAAIRARAERNA